MLISPRVRNEERSSRKDWSCNLAIVCYGTVHSSSSLSAHEEITELDSFFLEFWRAIIGWRGSPSGWCHISLQLAFKPFSPAVKRFGRDEILVIKSETGKNRGGRKRRNFLWLQNYQKISKKKRKTSITRYNPFPTFTVSISKKKPKPKNRRSKLKIH